MDHFNEVKLMIFLFLHAFGLISKKSVPGPRHKDIAL
jgi:hypothetical protein